MPLLTNEMIDDAKTDAGSWTRAQLAVLGVKWPPKGGWKGTIIGREFSEETLTRFRESASILSKKTLKRRRQENRPVTPEITPLALDVSLERARALHRVWRALNDGDCPKCHRLIVDPIRGPNWNHRELKFGDMKCGNCGFTVTADEVEEIEKMFAPAMDAAVALFEQWRTERA